MRCDEFSTRFDELLDERREPLDEPNMAAHVAECVDCRRTATSIGAVIGALADLRVGSCGVPACRLSVDRIVAALGRDEGESASAKFDPVAPAADLFASANAPAKSVTRSTSGPLWRGSAFYALIATAATVLLAAYPVWRWNAAPHAADPSGGPGGSQNIAHAPSTMGGANNLRPGDVKPGANPDLDPQTLPSFTELARESRDSYERLARDTQQSLGDALAVAGVFSSETRPYDSQSQPTDDWLNQVESGLEPLKRSTLGTLDVLRQVVPADTETRS